jgi:arylsulfatase A-like enzyme
MANPPNFLIIIADDLGYSDIGAFGGEIQTPNLDDLAQQGLRLTNFHTSPLCSVTRAMLISGTDSRIAGFGTMAESIASNQRGKRGYEGYLSDRIAALPEMLMTHGYRTFLSGKWHLGREPLQDPSMRGFQYSFALLQGAHNHFGRGLSTNPQEGTTYRENGRTISSLPADFYSSDYFVTKLIEQLSTSDVTEREKPFFAWLAFSAPHFPLQAPDEDIARYKGRYDSGFEVLRQERLKRQIALGLIKGDVVAHQPEVPASWESLSVEEKRRGARKMEVYAAMVDRLDQNIGRLLAELKRTGKYESTVILFLSDNGAEGTDYSKINLPIIRNRLVGADNSLENIGKATSWESYGPGWAQAATAPSWLYKSFETEGGTHTPAILRLPGSDAEIADAYLDVKDVVPTFLELAGVPAPRGIFQGRSVAPLEGRSWVAYLRKRATEVYSPDAVIAHELMGSRAARQGEWKITDRGDGHWLLFNMVRDPGETQDLSDLEPEVKARLVAAYGAYAMAVGVIIREDRPHSGA